jgi:zinc transport system substrate-binding protein
MYALEEDGKEATEQHLQDMVDLAKKENIKVIFYQKKLIAVSPLRLPRKLEGKQCCLHRWPLIT